MGASPIDPDALRDEDPRLSAGQANRIASALGAGDRDGRAQRHGRAAPRVEDRPSPKRPDPSTLRTAIEADLDAVDVMRRLLEELLRLVPSAAGAAIQVDGAHGPSVRHAVGWLGDDLSRQVSVPLDDGLPGGTLVVESSPEERFTAPERTAIESAAPVISAALSAASSLARAARVVLDLGGEEVALARLVGQALGPSMHDHIRRALVSERVRDVLDAGDVSMVFQPIADLRDGEIVGYEALARFPPPPRPVELWFTEAVDVGLGLELEVRTATLALSQADRVPEHCFLAVNVSPDTAGSTEFLEACESVDASRLVVEVTEHARVDDYVSLNRSLRRLRDRGVRLAIDDAGAGFSSLRHVLRLSPDLIKLDISLTRRIDTDPVRQALATSLISFAEEVGAVILAEGIETRWEADALTALGVRYGQGFHVARPRPLPA